MIIFIVIKSMSPALIALLACYALFIIAYAVAALLVIKWARSLPYQKRTVHQLALIVIPSRIVYFLFALLYVIRPYRLWVAQMLYCGPPFFIYLLLTSLAKPINSMAIRIKVATLLNNEVIRTSENYLASTKETQIKTPEQLQVPSTFKEYDQIAVNKIDSCYKKQRIISIIWYKLTAGTAGALRYGW
jgi:hypothetical protein